MTKNLIFILLILCSCTNAGNEKENYFFYHWKSNVKLSEVEKEILMNAKEQKLYLHFFDVDQTMDSNELYPIAVLKEVDTLLKDFEIVPVIYITNRSLLQERNIKNLGSRIKNLVDEMSQFHFDRTFPEIQLDCDWNAQTRNQYFELIEFLQETFEVSSTIRLHQIKYPQKTGVPPVKKGILMLYNVGDLSDFKENSILESSIVSQYVNAKTNYPLNLDIALPLFSQMVLKNNDGELRLLNRVRRNDLEGGQKHFQKKEEQIFEVIEDTLYQGFYLYKGYQIKLEEIEVSEIVKAYEIIENSQLKINEKIFYHLDEDLVKQIDVNKLLEAL